MCRYLQIILRSIVNLLGDIYAICYLLQDIIVTTLLIIKQHHHNNNKNYRKQPESEITVGNTEDDLFIQLFKKLESWDLP